MAEQVNRGVGRDDDAGRRNHEDRLSVLRIDVEAVDAYRGPGVVAGEAHPLERAWEELRRTLLDDRCPSGTDLSGCPGGPRAPGGRGNAQFFFDEARARVCRGAQGGSAEGLVV